MKYVIIYLMILMHSFTLFGQDKQSPEIITSSISAEDLEELDSTIIDLYRSGKDRFKVGDYASALPYFLKIDSLSKKYDFVNETTIKAVLDRSEISRITFTHAGVELAKDLQLEALKMAEQINSEEMIHETYVYLADIYGMVDDLPHAKAYTDKAFQYYKTHDNEARLANLYLTYMNYYYEVEQLDSAEIKLIEAVEYLESRNNAMQLARVKVFLARFYENRRNNSRKAIPLFEDARIIYQQLADTVQLTYLYVLEGLGMSHADLQNYNKAFQYYQLAYEARREYEKKKNTLLTRNLETKYQTESKQQEIDLLTIQNSLAQKEKANQRAILIAVIIIFLLLISIFYTLYNSRQKVTKNLRQINEMKSIFFANISHEFRTPLTLIKAPVEMQLASAGLTLGQREQLNSVNRNADRLLVLVDQLLDLSKLEAKKIGVSVSSLKEPAVWFNAITQVFQFSAEQKDIEFQVKIDLPDVEIFLDTQLTEKVINNLLTNAIKYTNEEGTIVFKATIDNGLLKIIVQNTGELISEENQSRIFDRFYQLNAHATGVGIGLALVKELVELHHGKISFTTDNSYNIFKVEVPIKKAAYSHSEIDVSGTNKDLLNGKRQMEKSSLSLDVHDDIDFLEEEITENLPILLIVEDNDEIRKLIRQQFEGDYNIKEAENGKKGIEIALEIVPDIIISDIMMPETDGIELTKQLKMDERTSHIPIILLTAKAGEENELIGLENKADDYILKPFSPENLKIRVHNLIEIRKRLRERYSQEVILKPKDIAISTHDEIFLEKVQKLLDEKLTESEFTSEYFSIEIGMSRMQLHRKLKALVGLSTTEFIRSQRLKMATHILLNSNVNISEVAYEVGFNDPSYFTKCFKASYGISPGNYAKAQLQK